MMPYSNMAYPMYSGQQMMSYSNMAYPMYSGQQMMPYSGMPSPMYSGQQMMPYTSMPSPMYSEQQMMPYTSMPSPMYSEQQMMPYTSMSSPMYSEQQMMPRDMQMVGDPQMVPHPILLVARQIAPNQIEIVYDQLTDLESATNVKNYWIRNNLDRPSDIATVARDDMMLLPTNSLTSNMAKITPVDNSRKRFIITFNINATTGVQYTVLPCFVNLQGKTGFGGENWGPKSRNTFTSQ
ncbi:hypothetical protein [Peribacillus butanolivorans]|uniref:hypothetical protein n=1 Tax=Peribacillus butanolivorans TaxID=421767 RepID=UPI0036A0C2A3